MGFHLEAMIMQFSMTNARQPPSSPCCAGPVTKNWGEHGRNMASIFVRIILLVTNDLERPRIQRGARTMPSVLTAQILNNYSLTKRLDISVASPILQSALTPTKHSRSSLHFCKLLPRHVSCAASKV